MELSVRVCKHVVRPVDVAVESEVSIWSNDLGGLAVGWVWTRFRDEDLACRLRNARDASAADGEEGCCTSGWSEEVVVQRIGKLRTGECCPASLSLSGLIIYRAFEQRNVFGVRQKQVRPRELRNSRTVVPSKHGERRSLVNRRRRIVRHWQSIVRVAQVEIQAGPNLFGVGETGCFLGGSLGLRKNREKNGCEDGNYRNHHQELDQSKSFTNHGTFRTNMITQ